MTTETVASDRPVVVRGLRLLWLMVVDFVQHVIVGPYRSGRLRATRWPRGLRHIVVIALLGYGIAVLGIVFSGALREALPLSVTVGSSTLSMPRPVLWVLVFLVVLAMALLQSAALHVTAWLAWSTTGLTVLVIIFAGALDNESLLSPGRLTTLGVALGIVVFTILRRRHSFAWWEFAVILPAIGLAFAVGAGRAAAQSAPSGIDFGPIMLSLTMSMIGQLAVPAAIVAGAAVAKLSASTALWAVGVARKRLPTLAVLIGLALVVVWRLWALVLVATSGEAVGVGQILASLVLVVVTAALWWMLARVRGGRRIVPTAARLVDRLGIVATPIAAALAITLVPLVVILLSTQVLFAYGIPLESIVWLQAIMALLMHSTAVGIVRLTVGLALVVAAVLLARRGSRTIPELLGGIGIVTVTVASAGLLGLGGWLWTSGGLTLVVTVGCLGLLLWFAVRRQLTERRVAGFAVALLLAAFVDQRDFVSDPLGALLGFTGVAFVLFGFVWSFLTGGGSANKNSAAFPRPARVLLFLANSVFGVTVLAFTALARNPNASINLGAFAEIGDQLFGTGLLVCAVLAVAHAIVGDRLPQPDPAAPRGHQSAGR